MNQNMNQPLGVKIQSLSVSKYDKHRYFGCWIKQDLNPDKEMKLKSLWQNLIASTPNNGIWLLNSLWNRCFCVLKKLFDINWLRRVLTISWTYQVTSEGVYRRMNNCFHFFATRNLSSEFFSIS